MMDERSQLANWQRSTEICEIQRETPQRWHEKIRKIHLSEMRGGGPVARNEFAQTTQHLRHLVSFWHD